MKVSEVSGGQSVDSNTSNVKKIQESSQEEVKGRKGNSDEMSEAKEITKEEVEEGMEKLNEAIQAFHEELKFELHDESERMMTKIVNTKKHEVIKEIPPKELLDMLGRIKDMVGLVLDEKI